MFNRGTYDRLAEATVLDSEQVRMFAENVLAEHDPERQGHGYDRCELCSFTHHPCDAFDLAAYVVMLLDRIAAPASTGDPGGER